MFKWSNGPVFSFVTSGFVFFIGWPSSTYINKQTSLFPTTFLKEGRLLLHLGYFQHFKVGNCWISSCSKFLLPSSPRLLSINALGLESTDCLCLRVWLHTHCLPALPLQLLVSLGCALARHLGALGHWWALAQQLHFPQGLPLHSPLVQQSWCLQLSLML